MSISNLDEIEQAVSQLSSEELARFRAWFIEFDAAMWDKQFENDVKTGRLDALAEKALKHLKQGNCSNL